MSFRAEAGGPPQRPPADDGSGSAAASSSMGPATLDAEAAAMARDAAKMVEYAHEAKILASKGLASALEQCSDDD
eukprot:15335433-Heterocapsa_arctica.AAC.1